MSPYVVDDCVPQSKYIYLIIYGELRGYCHNSGLASGVTPCGGRMRLVREIRAIYTYVCVSPKWCRLYEPSGARE